MVTFICCHRLVEIWKQESEGASLPDSQAHIKVRNSAFFDAEWPSWLNSIWLSLQVAFTLTIGELTERAMVSRAAFYRNYQDKYDLVEQIFEEAMSALLNAVGDLGREHPAEVWVKFFEHSASYERLYRALLGQRGSPWFVRKMRESLAGLVKERGHLPHGPNASTHPAHTFTDEFVPDLVSAMFVEAIIWWLEQGKPYTPKEIATRSALLASALFKEASTWQ